MTKLYEAKHLSVNCVENDPVDVRCGGPSYLGFDFFILKDKYEETKSFILDAMKELEIPFLFFIDEEDMKITEDRIWDQSRIYDELVDQKNYLEHAQERAIELSLFRR